MDKGRKPNSDRKAQRQPRRDEMAGAREKAREEALRRRLDSKYGDGGRKPIGKKPSGERRPPGVGAPRPLTLEERSGRFLFERKN